MSEQQHTELITALHGPWRTATRMVIVVLSAAGWTVSEIADLLHYDPKTVRAWIARHHAEGLTGQPDRPRSGRPRKGSRRLGERIHTLLQTPRSWTTTCIWKAIGRPQLSLSTMRRRIREQARWARPRLIAKSDPKRDSICAAIRERIAALPAGSVVLAEDETHLDLLARVRSRTSPPAAQPSHGHACAATRRRTGPTANDVRHDGPGTTQLANGRRTTTSGTTSS